jgi:hypothetical protein
MVFNAWEFRVDNQFDKNTLQSAVKNMIFTQLSEDEIVKKIKKRTGPEWNALYIRRFVLVLLYVIF